MKATLEAIGLALAGRAGARLADKLGIPVGRDSMLRLVRALPDPPIGTPEILGVDDFALRRGHVDHPCPSSSRRSAPLLLHAVTPACVEPVAMMVMTKPALGSIR